MAFVKNPHVYHTKFDALWAMPIESLNLAGSNLLALMRNLLNNEHLVVLGTEHIDAGSGGDATGPANGRSGWQPGTRVFYDVLGLFMLVYPLWCAYALHSFAALLVLLFISLRLLRGPPLYYFSPPLTISINFLFFIPFV